MECDSNPGVGKPLIALRASVIINRDDQDVICDIGYAADTFINSVMIKNDDDSNQY